MTMYWEDEKWLLEQNAAEFFVDALNAQLGTAYVVALHGDRPDIVIEDTNTHHQVGVEVTHLFYDAKEARMLLGRSGPVYNQSENIESYINRLNSLLGQKGEKAKGYADYGELALLVRVASPVFGLDDFNRYESLIEVPQCDYRYIWLLFYSFVENKWNLLKSLK
jgi:hypothetical protein